MLIFLPVSILMLISIFMLIFLQTSRSIYFRTMGLFIILVTIVIFYAGLHFPVRSFYVIGISLVLSVLGFLSDFYSATLRTWFFRVSSSASKGATYGTLIGIMFIPIAFGLNVAHGLLIGTLIGSFIGEMRVYGNEKSLKRMSKSTLGTVTGFYGMATKIIFGVQMVDIFISVL